MDDSNDRSDYVGDKGDLPLSDGLTKKAGVFLFFFVSQRAASAVFYGYDVISSGRKMAKRFGERDVRVKGNWVLPIAAIHQADYFIAGVHAIDYIPVAHENERCFW